MLAQEMKLSKKGSIPKDNKKPKIPKPSVSPPPLKYEKGKTGRSSRNLDRQGDSYSR